MNLKELQNRLTKTNRHRKFDEMVKDCGFEDAFNTLPAVLHLTVPDDDCWNGDTGKESSLCGLPWYMLVGSTTDYITFIEEIRRPRFNNGVCPECLREIRFALEGENADGRIK